MIAGPVAVREASPRPGPFLPPPQFLSFPVPTDDRLVVVARYESAGAAQLAQAQLTDAGVPAMLANTDQSGLAPLFAHTKGGVQVKVSADRADAARDVLGLND